MSDDLSCGTGVNCQEHEEKTWLKHKNVNLFSNDLTIIDRVYYVTIFSIFQNIFKLFWILNDLLERIEIELNDIEK